MDSTITIDGTTLTGDVATIAELYRLVSKIVSTGSYEHLVFEFPKSGDYTQTHIVRVTPDSTLSVILSASPADNLGDITPNIDKLRNTYG